VRAGPEIKIHRNNNESNRIIMVPFCLFLSVIDEFTLQKCGKKFFIEFFTFLMKRAESREVRIKVKDKI
jgi:hypothetical protein